MREEETALREEMMRRWRRRSDDDEWLDKWKEWGRAREEETEKEGRGDGDNSDSFPTSSTPSTSETNLNVMIGSAVVDMSLLYPAFFCVSIWPSLPCQGPRLLKCEQIIYPFAPKQLYREKPLFTGCVTESRQGLQQALTQLTAKTWLGGVVAFHRVT